MKHLLSSTAFLIFNKNLAKQVGINAAILLADLISKEEYFISNGMTDAGFLILKKYRRRHHFNCTSAKKNN
jgi:hypothetical protein